MRLGRPTRSHPKLPRFRKRNVKYRRTLEKMESLFFVLWLFSIKVYPISLAYDRRHAAKSWVRNYIYCSQLWTLRYIDGKTISFRTFQSSRLWKGKLCCCSLWWLPWVFITTTTTWRPLTLGKIICGTSQGVNVTYTETNWHLLDEIMREAWLMINWSANYQDCRLQFQCSLHCFWLWGGENGFYVPSGETKSPIWNSDSRVQFKTFLIYSSFVRRVL